MAKVDSNKEKPISGWTQFTLGLGALGITYVAGAMNGEPVRNFFSQKPQVRVEQMKSAKASGQVSKGACEPKPASCTINEATKVIKENMTTSSGTFSWDGDHFNMPKIYFKRDANNLKNAFACEELIVKEKKVIPVFKQEAKGVTTINEASSQNDRHDSTSTSNQENSKGASNSQSGTAHSEVNVGGNNSGTITQTTEVKQEINNTCVGENNCNTTVNNPAPTEQPQPTPVPTRGEKPSTATGPNGEIIDLVPTDRP